MNNSKLATLDIFPKFDRQFEHEARQKTVTGGIFSIACIFIIILLTIGELQFFLSVVETHEMLIDPNVQGDLTIRLDLTVHHVPCSILTVTSIDAFGGISGDFDSKIEMEAVKKDNSKGNVGNTFSTSQISTSKSEECGSCYGASDEGVCCRSCDDVRRLYMQKGWYFDIFNTAFTQCHEEVSKLKMIEGMNEGCRLKGSISFPRVAGTIHILPGRFVYAMGRKQFDPLLSFTKHLNFSHSIEELSFGEYFPGQLNPLVNSTQIRGSLEVSDRKKQANGRFSYFLQVIPTTFERRSLIFGSSYTIDSHQYSATQHFIPSTTGMTENQESHNAKEIVYPGVAIAFELSPIKVHIRQQHPYPSVTHLVLQLCAVCGGVFTVAGILDSLLFHGIKKVHHLRKII